MAARASPLAPSPLDGRGHGRYHRRTRLFLTMHVARRLAERGLDRAWVERVALQPEWVEPDPLPDVVRCFGPVPEAGGRVPRVAVADRQGLRHVLSDHFDRGAARRRP
jgi:hypothetical protein